MKSNNDVIVQISRNPSQQMREIIEETETSNFEALSEIILQILSDEKDALWQLRDPQNNKVDVTKKIEDTAADIYGIQSRELSYSNAIKYFIDKYPELLGKFCKFRNQCTINNTPEQTPNIYREWNNIDILIEWDEYVIVIENKIFSGINGKTENGSQLNKYEDVIKEINRENNKEHIFIILSPNHNNLSNQVNDNWTIITYRELYEFLRSIISAYSNDFLFVDFVKSLEDHSKDDYMKSVMHRKFVKAISK